MEYQETDYDGEHWINWLLIFSVLIKSVDEIYDQNLHRMMIVVQ